MYGSQERFCRVYITIMVFVLNQLVTVLCYIMLFYIHTLHNHIPPRFNLRARSKSRHIFLKRINKYYAAYTFVAIL